MRISAVRTLLSVPAIGPAIVRSYMHILNQWLWAAIVCLRLAVRRRRPDKVLVSMGTVVDALPLLLLRIVSPRTRFVCAVRGPHAANEGLAFPLLRRLFIFLERSSTAKADLVLANGSDTQRALWGQGIVSTVVPNGVSLARFAREPRAAPRPPGFPPAGTFAVVMTASLMPYRGVDTAIEALARLVAGGDTATHVAFAGKGDASIYRDLADRLGVGGRVHFLGERGDIADVVAHADAILALCDGAHAGGLSMSLLEAMAGGKPVIVWDNPCYRQVVSHEVDGLVIAERDPGALASALRRLADDSSLRAALGRVARQRVQEFDWERVTDRLIEVVGRFVPQEAARDRAH